MAYAFRCQNCQRLVPAEHAGENKVPHACPSCGKGVHFELDASGQPIKILDPDNWVVLADLSEEELAPIIEYHGDIEIESHTPYRHVLNEDKTHVFNPDGTMKTEPITGEVPPAPTGKFVSAEAVDTVGTEDHPS